MGTPWHSRLQPTALSSFCRNLLQQNCAELCPGAGTNPGTASAAFPRENNVTLLGINVRPDPLSLQK